MVDSKTKTPIWLLPQCESNGRMTVICFTYAQKFTTCVSFTVRIKLKIFHTISELRRICMRRISKSKWFGTLAPFSFSFLLIMYWSVLFPFWVERGVPLVRVSLWARCSPSLPSWPIIRISGVLPWTDS